MRNKILALLIILFLMTFGFGYLLLKGDAHIGSISFSFRGDIGYCEKRLKENRNSDSLSSTRSESGFTVDMLRFFLCSTDSDSDGLLNGDDNCQDDYNPMQLAIHFKDNPLLCL